MPASEPPPFAIVDTPEQLKAFTDPLRVRVLSILAREQATNQQVARMLGEPHAKVLHHVRALLEMGLIRLVDTRIKGGNVEKYYRAVARLFGVRPPPELLPNLAGAAFEIVRQEIEASAALWPEQPIDWEGRTARLSPERAEQFRRRLLDLIAEYWGGPPDRTASEDLEAPMLGFAAVMYRHPAHGVEDGESPQPSAGPGHDPGEVSAP